MCEEALSAPMKRILSHTLLLCLFFGHAFSQDSTIDSLLSNANRQTGDELGRTYYRLAVELTDIQADTALHYANQAELILTRNDPSQLLPHLFKSKGEIYRKLHITDRSLVYYSKAYDEFIKLENQQEIGNCALNMGNLYYEMADFSEAYSYYMHSLNAYERAGDQLGIARMENNLGTVAHEMGKLSEAERHYMNAYEIYKEYELAIEECQALTNIGLVIYDRELYDSALVYYYEALEKLNTDTLDSETKEYVLSGVYNNIALAYIDLGQYKDALEFLQLGLNLSIKIDDQYNIGTVYTNLGSLYGKMKDEDSALFYLHRALRIAQDLRFRHLELDVYDELARLHAGLGSYASAYNWQLRYDTLYKEVFNEGQSKQIAQLRARYEQEIKDREIEQLQSETQVQKMLNKVFVIFIVVIVALAIIIAMNLRSKKRTNQMLAERNLQISNTLQKLSESEQELQNLNKSKDRIFSVVAHDLRNPVAAVTGFSELLYDNFEQFPAETQKEYLLQILQGTQRIQNLLENLLIWARSQMKAVKYEPADLKVRSVIDECVKDVKANFDHKKIECIVKVDRKCVVYADKAMIYTVFRNLIMNAVKFSFPGGKIRITSENGSDVCKISVSDDGIGIQPEIQAKLFDANEVVTTPGTTGESGSGLGLAICKEFLERNKGTIDVESESGNGSTFRVTLPISKTE
jgi:signal transduction histidine kinase